MVAAETNVVRLSGHRTKFGERVGASEMARMCLRVSPVSSAAAPVARDSRHIRVIGLNTRWEGISGSPDV